jgi:hypothetical protein
MADDLTEMLNEAVEGELSVEEVDNTPEVTDEVEDAVEDIVDDDGDSDTDEPLEDEDDFEDEESPDEPVDDNGFNWGEIVSKYGDELVELTVNGQVVQKPLRELPNMAMMREDYSRKTAEVAQAVRAAEWAQSVQESFDRDPYGTLEAFAQAYGIDLAAGSDPVSDPYEGFDPDIAAVLRKMDEQEARHQQELQRVIVQTETFTEKALVEEIKRDAMALKDAFGDDLDEVEMLRVAAQYNLPLLDAAYRVMGEGYFNRSKSEQAALAKAEVAAESKTSRKNGSAKRRASSTTKRGFDGAGPNSISKDDFSDIGELFEIELNSVS